MVKFSKLRGNLIKEINSLRKFNYPSLNQILDNFGIVIEKLIITKCKSGHEMAKHSKPYRLNARFYEDKRDNSSYLENFNTHIKSNKVSIFIKKRDITLITVKYFPL